MDHRLLFLLCTVALMAIVAWATHRAGALLRIWTPPGNLLLSWPDNLARLALIALGAAAGLWLGPGPDQLGWRVSGVGRDLLLGAAAGLALFGLLSVGGRLAVRLWGPQIYETKMLSCIMPAGAAEWPAVALALAPAALLEELLFRSLALGGLASLVDPLWLLWPLSLLFGVLHWTQGGWGVVGTTVAGAVLGLLFLATGSLWPPLAAHYVFNLLQLVLAAATGVKPLRAPAASHSALD